MVFKSFFNDGFVFLLMLIVVENKDRILKRKLSEFTFKSAHGLLSQCESWRL